MKTQPRILFTIALFALGFYAAPAAFAQRDAKVPDPDPEIERKTFIVPDGFEVNLFAADPMLAKPIQMNFDPQGRLWVASSEVYPQIKPGQASTDRILILEDPKGEGKATKTTVFADGLLIPTGVVPGDGGAYVADSTDLVHFSDPDPVTGKARKKRIVLSGFGTEDTHHIIHTFQWGPDGLMYFNQSIYIHSHIETPHGVRRLNAGGTWQFRPETLEMNVFARGLVNSWGMKHDRWGQTFATDGAGGEGINLYMPGAYYMTAFNPPRLLSGLNPGSPKHCGLAVLSGRHLPEEYRGSLVTNDFRGHRVCRFVLKDDGSGYASQEKQEIIKSNHPAFRPIDVAMGPDGAIYVADWYNPIIQHGEVDFRDPRRDKTHGRIWRITAKNRPLVEKPKLVGASIAELLNQLKAPEDWTRLMAKQVLKEQGVAKVLPELAAWVSKLDTQDPDFEHHRLEALWVYQGLNVVEPKLLDAVLNSKDYRARAATCRVVTAWATRLPNPMELLASRVSDDQPQVRLDAVRALSTIPNSQAAVIAARALDKPVDKWLDYGIWMAMHELAPVWLDDVKAGKLDFNGNPRHLVFALQASGSGDVVGPLMGLLNAGKIAKERQPEVWMILAQLGGPTELGFVVKQSEGTSPELQSKLLATVEESARSRKVGAPKADVTALITKTLDSEGGTRRQSAAKLSGLWKIEANREKLQTIARTTTGDDRRAAFEGLVSLGGVASQQFFRELINAKDTSENQRPALVALTKLDLKSAAALSATFLQSAPATAELSELFAAFVNRKDGPAELTKALAGKKIPADVAKLGVQAAKATAQADAKLIDALTTAGELTVKKWALAGKELDQFLTDVAKLGDPVRGEKVYRQAAMNCLKCHAIAGAGGQVGPDMSSIGASAPVDYLVESLLNPNAKIKEGYNSFIVTTVDDRIFTGIRVRETNTELVLRDNEDREVLIPKADIAQRKDGKSLMPEGLVDPLTRQELLDLTRFLSELGKGSYAATPGRVVRSWQALQPTKEMYTILNRQRLAAVAVPDPGLAWAAAYSAVSGDLTPDATPAFQWNQNAPLLSVVRFQLDVTTAGKVKLVLNESAGLTIWIDGNPIEPASSLALDLATGVHTVTLTVESSKRTKPLRVELEELSESTARVRILGGK